MCLILLSIDRSGIVEPLFLQGVFQNKIWGGTKLREEFGYEIPTEKTGEYWAISAHPNGPAKVINGKYSGKTIAELWEEHRELFGNQEGEVFPLLTKLIDAQNDLSVQVHPDDKYGLIHEGELGKTECWYIVAADEGAEIIFGHNATTSAEFKDFIKSGKWDNLLRKVKVKAGDFFYVPSGTVHAIGSGVMVLETQQSSDTTYRLYDYNRPDQNGKMRELHIKDSIAVSTIPHEEDKNKIKVIKKENGTLATLVSNEFFTVSDWKLSGNVTFSQESLYTLVSVLDGMGSLKINKKIYPLNKGDHFILPNNVKEWMIEGEVHIISSTP